MFAFERPVNVCVGEKIGEDRSGVIWTKRGARLVAIPFLIDKMSLVKRGFNPFTYARVMRQIRAMGIEPESVELYCGDTNYVYDGQSYKNKVGIPVSFDNRRPVRRDMELTYVRN